jgi:type II secretory pathway component GspD/PulD (secretin)
MKLFLKICLIVFGVVLLNTPTIDIVQGQQLTGQTNPDLENLIKRLSAIEANNTQAANQTAQPPSNLTQTQSNATVVTQIQQTAKEAQAEPPSVTPIIHIQPLEGKEKLYSFELREVEISDLFRVLAQDYKLNLLVDEGIKGRVTASLSNVSLEEALATIAESQNLILKKKGNIIRVMPNLITKTFNLQYIEAKKLLESPSAGQSMGTIYDLLSKKGKIFLGNQPNSIMVVDYPENIKKVEEFVKVTDQRMATKVFKLKYLKAADVLGGSTTTATTTQTSTAGGTTTQTTTTQGAPK